MGRNEFLRRLETGEFAPDASGRLKSFPGKMPTMERGKKESAAPGSSEIPVPSLPAGVKGAVRLIFNDLPKVSNNQFYAGVHWAARKQMKDRYYRFITAVHPEKFVDPCFVFYIFQWKSRSLDPSNCIGMIKMIEDCLFPSDSYKVIKGLWTECVRGKRDRVILYIIPVE